MMFSLVLFVSDGLCYFSKDLNNEHPFLSAQGKMSTRLLVTPFSFSFVPWTSCHGIFILFTLFITFVVINHWWYQFRSWKTSRGYFKSNLRQLSLELIMYTLKINVFSVVRFYEDDANELQWIYICSLHL